MKSRKRLLERIVRFLAVLVFVVAWTGSAWAANCPYCGRSYGEAAPWGGERERLEALRLEHEATCPARYASGSSSYAAPSYGANAWSGVASNLAGSFMDGWNRGMEAVELNNLGNAAFERNDFDTAVSYYEQALQLSPGNALFARSLQWAHGGQLNEKGVAAYNSGDYDTALTFFEQAEALNPQGRAIVDNLRETRARIAEREAAIERALETLKREAMTEELRDAPSSQNAGPPREIGEADLGEARSGGQRLQEDYYRTLEVKEVPPPVVPLTGAVGAPAPPAAVPNESGRPGFWEEARKAAGKVGDGFRMARKAVRDWLEEQSFRQTIDRIPGISTLRGAMEKGKKVYEDLRRQTRSIFDHAMHGASEGSKRLADPNDRGRFEEEYHRGLGELGEETRRGAEKSAHDAM